MKKVIIIFLLFCTIWTLPAQEEVQRAQLSARIGVVGTTLLIPNSTITSQSAYGYNTNTQLKIGLTGGLIVDIHLANKWFLQSGVMYGWHRFHQNQTAVYTQKNTHYSIATENLYKMHRIKVPVMVFYHGSLQENHFVAGLGAYVDAAVGGDIAYDASAVITNPEGDVSRYTGTGNFNPFLKDSKYLFYSLAGDDYYKKYHLYTGNILNRFNVGLSAEIGYQVSKFYVGVHADVGLLNVMNTEFAGESYKQRLFNVQLLFAYKIN